MCKYFFYVLGMLKWLEWLNVTCADQVQPHTHEIMRQHLLEIELTRARGFCQLLIQFATKLLQFAFTVLPPGCPGLPRFGPEHWGPGAGPHESLKKNALKFGFLWELRYLMNLGAVEIALRDLVLTLCCACARWRCHQMYLQFPYVVRDLVRLLRLCGKAQDIEEVYII